MQKQNKLNWPWKVPRRRGSSELLSSSFFELGKREDVWQRSTLKIISRDVSWLLFHLSLLVVTPAVVSVTICNCGKYRKKGFTCQQIWPAGSSRLHCSPCNRLRARCRRAPGWERESWFPIFLFLNGKTHLRGHIPPSINWIVKKGIEYAPIMKSAIAKLWRQKLRETSSQASKLR